MPHSCPICHSTMEKEGVRWNSDDKYGIYYSCPLCGEFVLTDTAVEDIKSKMDNPNNASLLSHVVRKIQTRYKYVYLTSYDIDNVLLNSKLPTPIEQANNLIIWLGKNLPAPGEPIWVEPEKYRSIIGAKTPNGFALVLKYLFEIGILDGRMSEAIGAPGRAHITLSMNGWEKYEELMRGNVASRRAFMAMKYGDPILDKVVDDYFKPEVGKTGFLLFRLDDQPKAGLIDDRIRVEIRTSSFLISDLTHDNPGAYWEAGFAEGLGKPVIYTCEKQKFLREKTHFDTNHHLTVIWDKDKPQDGAVLLKSTIRATLPDSAIMVDE